MGFMGVDGGSGLGRGGDCDLDLEVVEECVKMVVCVLETCLWWK